MPKSSRFARLILFGLCLGFGPSPVQAELFRSYWRLQAEQFDDSHDVRFDKPFLRQNLIPVKSVVLLDDVTPAHGGPTYPKGSPLFIIFSKDGRSAFCTIKDRSFKNQTKTLFIPLLDARPCFRDRDGDGRFDAVFYVTDALSDPLLRVGIWMRSHQSIQFASKIRAQKISQRE